MENANYIQTEENFTPRKDKPDLPESFWGLNYTYLYDYKGDPSFLIFQPDAFGFGGRLVHTRPEEEQNIMREKIADRGNYVPCFEYENKLHPFVDIKEAPINELKRRWKENYFKYIPFKVDENGLILSEQLFNTEWLTTIDEYRANYVDIYVYEPDHQEDFSTNKAIWLAAKEYVRQMADLIWDNL